MSRGKILIIDDDESICEVVDLLLSSEDFVVLQARNGVEGLALARSSLPNLILLDIIMPEMNGHVCATMLKSDPATASIPIILITATAQMAGGITLTSPAIYKISKPFEPEELIDKINEVLTPKR